MAPSNRGADRPRIVHERSSREAERCARSGFRVEGVRSRIGMHCENVDEWITRGSRHLRLPAGGSCLFGLSGRADLGAVDRMAGTTRDTESQIIRPDAHLQRRAVVHLTPIRICAAVRRAGVDHVCINATVRGFAHHVECRIVRLSVTRIETGVGRGRVICPQGRPAGSTACDRERQRKGESAHAKKLTARDHGRKPPRYSSSASMVCSSKLYIFS